MLRHIEPHERMRIDCQQVPGSKKSRTLVDMLKGESLRDIVFDVTSGMVSVVDDGDML